MSRAEIAGARVEEQPSRRQVGEAQVVGDGQVGAEQRLLVDERDAGQERVTRRGEPEVLAEEGDPARVRLEDPGQQAAERALARAVLAAEGVAGPGADVEGD